MKNNKILVFSEPDLEFRYRQKAKDPRDGLGLFGPFDADLQSYPKLNYIVLGTSTGIDAFFDWAGHMNRPVIDAPNDNFRLWPPFPGFQVAFNQKFPETPIWSFSIDQNELLYACISHKEDAYHGETYLFDTQHILRALCHGNQKRIERT